MLGILPIYPDCYIHTGLELTHTAYNLPTLMLIQKSAAFRANECMHILTMHK